MTSELLLLLFGGVVAVAIVGEVAIFALGLRQKGGKAVNHAIRGITVIVRSLLGAFVAMSVGLSAVHSPTAPTGSEIAAASYSITA